MTRHRITGEAVWPMDADEWARGAETYAGVPLRDLSNATGVIYGAHGHIDPTRMVAAATAAEEAAYAGIPDQPATITPGHVDRTWAVMEPSYQGAPDDEWHVNCGDEITRVSTAMRSRTKRNQHLTFRANMGVGRHGWLRLTPAYGVRLVRERISHLPVGSIVTDPFSGTGTTPLAAAELGHLGQSVDVNPFLIWLGEAKTHHYSEDIAELAGNATSEVVTLAREVALRTDPWLPKLHNIERWWSPANLAGLSALRWAIDSADRDPEVRALHEISLCRTLIARSNAAFNHQSMSFKDQTGNETLFSVDEVEETLSLFASQSNDVADSAAYDLLGSATIVKGDSREKLADLEPCDLLLTSPPYVNRMSYIRELRPYMYWLRFLDRASDAGDLDWEAIGGTWGTATSRLNTWKPEALTPIEDPMQETCEKISRDGGKNGPLLATYVRKYFHDMWLHFQAAADHVKSGGTVSYIVGNSTFYGHVVPAEKWYSAMLRELGFESITADIIRKRNSNKDLFEYDVSARRP